MDWTKQLIRYIVVMLLQILLFNQLQLWNLCHPYIYVLCLLMMPITLPHNIDMLIGDSRLVIDALDNVLTRAIVSRKAAEYKIPFVHGAVQGSLGQVTTFLANTKSYEEMFNLPSLNRELTDELAKCPGIMLADIATYDTFYEKDAYGS